nr:reverse transcriptase domain-containing protein [Tanacetum cinerariifolium]
MKKFLQIFQSLHFEISFSDALLSMPKFASTFKNFRSHKEKLFEVATNTLVNENCLAVILKKFPEKLGDPDEAITFKVGNTSKFSYNDVESINRIDVIDVALEEYSQEVLGFSGNSKSGNPTPASEPIIARSSPSLTPFEGGDFILKEIKSHDSVPQDIDSEDISKFISTFPIPMENCDFFFKKSKRFTSVPEFKTFRFYSEERVPMFLFRDLKDDDKERVIKVLKSHKHAIARKLSDIKGIDPQFCTHKILMEEDFKPAVQH